MIKNHVQTQSYYLAVAEPVIKPEACIYLPYRYGSYDRTGNQRPKFVCFPPYNYGSPNALCDWLVNSLNCDVQLILQEHSGLGVSTFQYPCFHTGRFNQPQWCTIAEYIYWKKLKYKWTHTFCSRVNCIIYIYIFFFLLYNIVLILPYLWELVIIFWQFQTFLWKTELICLFIFWFEPESPLHLKGISIAVDKILTVCLLKEWYEAVNHRS